MSAYDPGVRSSGDGDAVLLVGVDPESWDVVRRVLEEDGFRVEVAESFASGIARVEAGAVSVVIAETDGPVAGIERFALELDQRVGGGRVPLVVVAPLLSHALVNELHDLGVADLLNRPFSPEDLVRRVRGVLRDGERRSRRDSEALPADRAGIEGLAPDVFAAVPDRLVVVGADMRIALANRAFASALDMTPEELIGADLATALLPALSEVDGPTRLVRGVLDGRRPAAAANLNFRGGAGDTCVVDLTVTPFTHRGTPHALLSLHDVTEHWFSERLVEGEKRKLEDIVNGMGAALAVLDPALVVRWANRTFTDWFGALWGKRFDLALRGFTVVGDTDPAKVFPGREHVSREWVFFASDGDRRYFRHIVVPARDPQGGLRELVVVTQDLTGITLRSEQHRLMQELGQLVQTTLDLDRLLYVILTCATAGHALGFNRAFVFLVSPDGRELRGEMAVGPATAEEAFVIWGELAGSNRGLAELTADFERFRARPQPLTDLVRRLRYRLTSIAAEREVLVRTCVEGRTQVVRDADADERVSGAFRQTFRSREFVCLPLRGKGRVLGVVLADNVYSGRPLSSEQVSMLELFGAAAGLSLDNARTYAELKESLNRLKETSAKLIHSERLATVGQLAANVAHEIRNPLATIGGFARSILKKPGDAERARESAAIISEEVSRLEAILSEIMDFTRPAQPNLSPHAIEDAVERVALTMQPEFTRLGAELVRERTGRTPPVLYDENHMQQVLVNLVRNALEAMAESLRADRPMCVTIRTFAAEGKVVVEVEDSGPGIALEYLPRLFEPFFSRKERGTGLGLAVVRKILHDHGGEVSARNAPGGGAIFSFWLPEEGPKAVEPGATGD